MGVGQVWVSVPAMALIAAAYSFSFGPLCWLVTAELFSVRCHFAIVRIVVVVT